MQFKQLTRTDFDTIVNGFRSEFDNIRMLPDGGQKRALLQQIVVQMDDFYVYCKLYIYFQRERKNRLKTFDMNKAREYMDNIDNIVNQLDI